MSPRHILVTGGSGFIGPALVKRLLRDGCAVRVFDDNSRGAPRRLAGIEKDIEFIGGDIRDVYSEAKGVGYDVKTMRKVVSLRSMDAADRAEQETLLDTYKHALGMS